MEKTLSWHVDVPHGDIRRHLARGSRRHLARGLRLAARALARWGRQLATDETRSASDPVLEFYAEAGAPEGALYVDGQRVAVLPGVTRL